MIKSRGKIFASRRKAETYDVMLNTDDKQFDGFGLTNDNIQHVTNYDPLYDRQNKDWLKLYIPARSAVVLWKN